MESDKVHSLDSQEVQEIICVSQSKVGKKKIAFTVGWIRVNQTGKTGCYTVVIGKTSTAKT